MKTIEDHFADWERDKLGLGYGTGEEPVLGALKAFMSLTVRSDDGITTYDSLVIEEKLGVTVAWLLINFLGNNGLTDWGCSARFGWLTSAGNALKDFIDQKSLEELVDICTREQEYSCFHDNCQCKSYNPCNNPFWGSGE